MPFPLSEKAKGKQKALEPPINPNPPQSPEEEIHRALVIRFTEGIPDLIVDVRKQDSVRDVKRNVGCNRIENLWGYLTRSEI